VETRSHRNIEHEFDRLLVESLDENVAMILGEIAKKVVYEILEKKYTIARNRIPERLNELTSAFETMFGAVSSTIIVRVIVKRLYSELGLTYVERPDWRLPDYVSEARSRTKLLNNPVEILLLTRRLCRIHL